VDRCSAYCSRGSPMPYTFLADMTVLLHLGFVAFVATGGFLAWRYPVTLVAHLPAGAWALGIVVIGWPCPLTVMDQRLRRSPALARTRGPSWTVTSQGCCSPGSSCVLRKRWLRPRCSSLTRDWCAGVSGAASDTCSATRQTVHEPGRWASFRDARSTTQCDGQDLHGRVPVRMTAARQHPRRVSEVVIYLVLQANPLSFDRFRDALERQERTTWPRWESRRSHALPECR